MLKINNLSLFIISVLLTFFFSCEISQSNSEVSVAKKIIQKNDSVPNLFNESYPEIKIIGSYTGLVLKNDSIQQVGLDKMKSIKILKDDLYAGYLTYIMEGKKLKNICESNKKFLYNKRGYFLFNEDFTKVCSIMLPSYDENEDTITTSYSVYSLDKDCFELTNSGFFKGEDVNSLKVESW